MRIIPAILTDNKEDLKNKLKKVELFADWVQIDIMDGSFVNNNSFSLLELKNIETPLNLEIHLMVNNPEDYFADCQIIGAKRVIWQIEGSTDPEKTLELINNYNFEKGIALKPETPVKEVAPYLSKIDLVLLLAVNPGFQGQEFDNSVFEKIKKLKASIKNIECSDPSRFLAPDVKIEIDGGVNEKNAKELVEAGVDYLAVGSYLFNAENSAKNFNIIKDLVKK